MLSIIYHKKCVVFVGALLHGEKSGKIAGILSFIVLSVVEEIKLYLLVNESKI